MINIPNEITFRDKIGIELFELIKEDKDFIAIFYLDNMEDAVAYNSDDIIEFDNEWVNIKKGDKSFTVFKLDNVVCVSTIVGKELANGGDGV